MWESSHYNWKCCLALPFYKVPGASSNWRHHKLKNPSVKLGFICIFTHSTNENSLQIRKKYNFCKQLMNLKWQQQCRLPFGNHFCFSAVFSAYFDGSSCDITRAPPTYIVLVQTVAQLSERCRPVLSPHHQLCNHGVIMHRNLITWNVAIKQKLCHMQSSIYESW